MLKPRLLSSQFVQKVIEEQKVKVSTMKSLFHSKNFYIFVGIMAFLLIIFLIYRYFDKKERVCEIENTQENIPSKKFQKQKEEEIPEDEEDYENEEEESIYPDEVIQLAPPQQQYGMEESRETPIQRNRTQENMENDFPQEIDYH
jgi:uncharacterized membrane protein YgaE (UPF0421/DUF939 family)